MKLGTSQRGTLVPALVALTVLAATAALAGRAEPPTSPEPGPPVEAGRSGHRDGAGPDGPGEGASADPAQGCTGALEAGSAALEDSRGLGRAIEVIVERCGRSPGSLGLVNALARLQQNRERQAANEHRVGPADGTRPAPAEDAGREARPKGHTTGGGGSPPHGRSSPGSAVGG